MTRRRRLLGWGTIGFVLLAIWLAGKIGFTLAQADMRPTVVIVCVPVAWSGDMDDFKDACRRELQMFLDRSGIETYARVEVKVVGENMAADLNDDGLLSKMIKFGVAREAGDYYIGLTNDDLVLGGNSSVLGWTYRYGTGLMAEVTDEHEVVAHELGHIFGLCDEYSYGAWKRSDDDEPCPNPYPPDCELCLTRLCCDGEPLSGGGYCIMGPGGLNVYRDFGPNCKPHLASAFATAFPPLPAPVTPAPTTTPGSTPTRTPPPTPAPSPTPPLSDVGLAFSSNRGGSFDIYFWEPTRPGLLNLTNSAADAYQPAWSPDGKRLIFVSTVDGDLELYLMNGPGSRPIQLTDNRYTDSYPAWSPDGQEIVFVSDRDGVPDLYRLRLEDGTLIRLTDDAAQEASPAWSTDGRRLVFAANRDGQFDLYLLDLEQGSLVRLTDDPGDEVQPAWMEEDILFASNRDGDFDIYRLARDGRWTPLTFNDAHDLRPVWMASARKIAFQSDRDGNMDIYVMDANGDAPMQVTRHPGADAYPAYRPSLGGNTP